MMQGVKCLAFLAVFMGSFEINLERAQAQRPALKTAFAEDFLVGAALSMKQIDGQAPAALDLVKQQFNSITPENCFKWESIHPQPGQYQFDGADKFVEFGETHGMFMVGHTLIWHNQTPAWVFNDEQGNPLSREALLARMREHIHTVVGRYRGRIQGWDVVNEALVTNRLDERKGAWRKTPWYTIIGPDYLAKAFQFAQEADPNAQLYYNDYDTWKFGKRNYLVQLVNELRAKGLPLDGIGLQGHWGLDYPTVTELELLFRDLKSLNVQLMLTELDINVLPRPLRHLGADVTIRIQDRPGFNPFPQGLPDDVQRQLTERYEILFRIFKENRQQLSRVTFWGVEDGQSWRNYWPIAGRTNYPLLFDRNYQPKPAFHAVIGVARTGKKSDEKNN